MKNVLKSFRRGDGEFDTDDIAYIVGDDPLLVQSHGYGVEGKEHCLGPTFVADKFNEHGLVFIGPLFQVHTHGHVVVHHRIALHDHHLVVLVQDLRAEKSSAQKIELHFHSSASEVVPYQLNAYRRPGPVL